MGSCYILLLDLTSKWPTLLFFPKFGFPRLGESGSPKNMGVCIWENWFRFCVFCSLFSVLWLCKIGMEKYEVQQGCHVWWVCACVLLDFRVFNWGEFVCNLCAVGMFVHGLKPHSKGSGQHTRRERKELSVQAWINFISLWSWLIRSNLE